MDSCDFYTTLGKKLRARRRTKHMTLSDLSKKLNKSVATISKYEKGEVLISIDTLVDICQILNIDIASLLGIWLVYWRDSAVVGLFPGTVFDALHRLGLFYRLQAG